jgi:hypothetical protein
MQVTDAQLVARCREGEGEAWSELVERFSRYVYAIAVGAYRLSPADAEGGCASTACARPSARRPATTRSSTALSRTTGSPGSRTP